MNFFTKKKFLFKLITCLCLVLVLINSTGIQRVYATDDGSGVGGILIGPICHLLQGLGDAIMNILQKSIMGTEATLQMDNSDPDWWDTLKKVAIALILIAAVVVTAIIAPGVLVAAFAKITSQLVVYAVGFGAMCLVLGTDTTTGALKAGKATISAVASTALSDIVVLPQYTISPEEIFSGHILLFDANIFEPKTVYVEYESDDEDNPETGSMSLTEWKKQTDGNYHATGYYYKDGEEKIYTSVNNSAYELSSTISKWYYIIRTVSLIASMLILVYIGIRIIVTSVSAEKAKYKQMLSDWVIALCLIVLMHYIMIFAHNIVNSITKIFNEFKDSNLYVATIDEPGENLIKAVKALEEERGIADDEKYYVEDGSNKYIRWPTNLMGRFRIEAQEADNSMDYVGYTLAFLALVLFTLIFSFTYIKRLLYLLFLTIIAPLVALTYPIDKIHDGKAQAFDMWLKEYIFNLLIQPFHLLLYTIFVSMAFEMASTNTIYALVVLGFMVPAEKFLRTMFGFNKASTSGGLFAGAGGAALAMSAVNSLSRFAKGGPGKGPGKGPGGNDKNEKQDRGKLRTSDPGKSQSDLYGDLAGTDSDSQNTETQLPMGSDDEERERLATERATMDEFLDELTTPGSELDEGNLAAYEELDRELAAQEDAFRQREVQRQQQQLVNQQQVDTDTQQNSARPKKSRARRFAGATLKTVGGSIREGAISGLKSTPKTALKLAGGATGAMLGGAAGIVSGDPSATFKDVTAGAGAGYAITGGIANRISNNLNDGGAALRQWQENYYGDDYKQAMRDKADKEFMKDREIRKQFDRELKLNGDKKKINEAMEQAKKYREYGVNDNSIIIRAMKSTNAGTTDRDSKERIAAAKMAENSKAEKDLQTNMKRFKEVPGMSSQQVKRMESMVREINNL